TKTRQFRTCTLIGSGYTSMTLTVMTGSLSSICQTTRRRDTTIRCPTIDRATERSKQFVLAILFAALLCLSAHIHQTLITVINVIRAGTGDVFEVCRHSRPPRLARPCGSETAEAIPAGSRTFYRPGRESLRLRPKGYAAYILLRPVIRVRQTQSDPAA